eukprot:4640091-Prymnesium_polylepis.1
MFCRARPWGGATVKPPGRVRPRTARNMVIEYVRSASRPSCVPHQRLRRRLVAIGLCMVLLVSSAYCEGSQSE